MKSNTANKWICAVALLGALLACGGRMEQAPDFSADLQSTAQQALVGTQDGGTSISQLDINPPAPAPGVLPSMRTASDANLTKAAQAFAVQYASHYGLAAGAPGLDLLSIRRSLKGVHVTLQEKIGGIPVAASTFTVSFDNSSGNVYRVHTAVPPHQPIKVSKSRIDQDEAYDIAWRHLGVSGELTALPRSSLTYIPDSFGSGQLLLVYRIDLQVSAPFGAWQVDVDADTGAVLAVTDASLPRHKAGSAPRTFGASNEPLADRNAAFAQALASEAAKNGVLASKVNGTGLVFDPDPVTALRDTGLSNTSSASSFDNAYVTVTLSDISQTSGVYRLDGPWARIADFEQPNTAPSTTTTGNWTARRGNNAFNDVMSYFHIDRNQRYIQSLGYTGKSGIQNAPIEIDSDGYNGADNSHYIPSSNRIAYGHGGVDDNEDADVILHEYMHAMVHAINNSWTGGDTGAMDEGFADYWAASNNIDTFAQGFDNARVCNWDANGVDNFWTGRRVDRTNLRYDSKQTYGAHVSISGGESDELWSTPLFQALLALRDAGVPKSQVDTIILEAQFGLGSNITMPQMATAIVDTAKRLYPMGSHAGILSTKLVAQNILENVDWNLFAALNVAVSVVNL